MSLESSLEKERMNDEFTPEPRTLNPEFLEE